MPLTFAIALLALGPALDAPPPPGGDGVAPASPESPWRTTISLDGSHAFKSDLRDGPGRVSVSRASIGVDISYALNEKWRLGVAVDSEANAYNFSNATVFVGGTSEPFNDVYSSTISPSVSYIIDNDWSVFGGGLFSFAGEPDADIGESFTGGAFAAARYAFSETFALSAGLAVSSRLEDSTLFIPIIGVEWQVSPTVRFQTDKLGARLTAKLNKEWTLGLYGSYQLREFRLEDDSPNPSGVVRDSAVPIGVSIQYAPSTAFDVTLKGGAVVYQKYRFDDSDGDRIAEDNTRPAPFIALNLSFHF